MSNKHNPNRELGKEVQPVDAEHPEVAAVDVEAAEEEQVDGPVRLFHYQIRHQHCALRSNLREQANSSGMTRC